MTDFKKYIREIPDFPVKGIGFKDITPLLLNPEACRKVVSAIVEGLNSQKIDKVVGIESRGFFFGMLLAQELNAGFVPVRKPGKLPFNTHSQKYALEYGTDTLEIHQDSIKKGQKVLLHDDVLATGGTAQAACNLIEIMGGEIMQCNFIMELTFLNGREKLKGFKVKSLISY